MASLPNPRRVAILVYPGVQSLDVTGPLEVFTGADAAISAGGRREGGSPAPGYEVCIVGPGGPMRSSSGLAIVPECGLEDLAGPLDTLIVPGGAGRRQAEDDEQLVQWIARISSSARRTVSVCTGAFLLAAGGAARTAAAPPPTGRSAQELADAYPEVHVDPDPIYIRDGRSGPPRA